MYNNKHLIAGVKFQRSKYKQQSILIQLHFERQFWKINIYHIYIYIIYHISYLKNAKYKLTNRCSMMHECQKILKRKKKKEKHQQTSLKGFCQSPKKNSGQTKINQKKLGEKSFDFEIFQASKG